MLLSGLWLRAREARYTEGNKGTSCVRSALKTLQIKDSWAPMNAAQQEEALQPGQLGTRHFFGAMTVATIVLGVSAARMRTMSLLEAAQVALHWLIVLGIAGGGFALQSAWRRRIEKSAGVIWLRVLQKPVTESRRRIIRWLLTLAVVLDGIFISLVFSPGSRFKDLGNPSFPVGIQFQFLAIEGGLWWACLNHWVRNVYWVQFREQGILIDRGFLPWKSISRIAWSPVRPQNLVILHRGHFAELPIEPAAHQAVNSVLERVGMAKHE
jgi:hypothetical protein